jgi:hypothetical protein
MNAWIASFVKAVEDAGGTVQRSHDGHLKVFDVDGRFVYKMRSRGDDNGAMGRAILRRITRRVKGDGCT